MAKIHWCSGIIFWLIKTLFKFIYSWIKFHSKIGLYFPNNQIFCSCLPYIISEFWIRNMGHILSRDSLWVNKKNIRFHVNEILLTINLTFCYSYITKHSFVSKCVEPTVDLAHDYSSSCMQDHRTNPDCSVGRTIFKVSHPFLTYCMVH